MFDSVALQRAEVVAIAQLGEQLLEDRPVPLATGNSELTIEVAFDVVLDAVVVEQCIVHIDEKNDRVRQRHDRLREHFQVAFEKILFAGRSKRAQRQGARRSMSGGVLLYVDAKSVECNEA